MTTRRFRSLRAAALAVAGVLLFQSFVPDADAAAGADRLNPDEQLTAGQRLVSPNSRFVLVMQGDGNLVEYAPGSRAVWASGTDAAGSVVRMQGDGNLVVIAPGQPAGLVDRHQRVPGCHPRTAERRHRGGLRPRSRRALGDRRTRHAARWPHRLDCVG